MDGMSNTTSPVIELEIGAPATEVHVACFTGQHSDIPDSVSALELNANALLPAVATASLDPAKPRSVIITPPATGNGGSGSVFAGEIGGVASGVFLQIHTVPPPNVKSVVYVSHGPVQ
jgi:hypothetical protein